MALRLLGVCLILALGQGAAHAGLLGLRVGSPLPQRHDQANA